MEEVVSAIRVECLSLVPTNSIVPEVNTESTLVMVRKEKNMKDL